MMMIWNLQQQQQQQHMVGNKVAALSLIHSISFTIAYYNWTNYTTFLPPVSSSFGTDRPSQTVG